ncbi:MAG: hypothetical protein ACI841_000285 [Planctomycetota bacterium]
MSINDPTDRTIPGRSTSELQGTDHYELEEEIGRGGAGTVHRAHKVGSTEFVALKLLGEQHFASERGRERFDVEAVIASRLHHAGIVRVLDIGQRNGNSFYTMPLIEGGSLKERLEAGPIEPSETVQLLLELCDAVRYAHGEGIVHRDLKPANVLFDKAGHARITDFGLAKDVETDRNLTMTGEIVGTPNFMAPEQVSGASDIGPGADIYALGSILYCCLTGRPPFNAASIVETLQQVVSSTPVPPKLSNPSVPRALDSICMKCLEKDPHSRYSTASQLADDLEAYSQGLPVLAGESRRSALMHLLLQESRHPGEMERWSGIGMAHAGLALAVFTATGLLLTMGVASVWVIGALWVPGAVIAALIPWWIRPRKKPLSLIERQLAQIWILFGLSASVTLIASVGTQIQAMDLIPVLMIECALTVAYMSMILRGSFYFLSAAYALSATAVAFLPSWSLIPAGLILSFMQFMIAWRAREKQG